MGTNGTFSEDNFPPNPPPKVGAETFSDNDAFVTHTGSLPGASPSYSAGAGQAVPATGPGREMSMDFVQGFYQDERGFGLTADDSLEFASTATSTASIPATDSFELDEADSLNAVANSTDEFVSFIEAESVEIFDTDAASVADEETALRLRWLDETEQLAVAESEELAVAATDDEQSAVADRAVSVTRPATEESGTFNDEQQLTAEFPEQDSLNFAEAEIVSVTSADNIAFAESAQTAAALDATDSVAATDTQSNRAAFLEYDSYSTTEQLSRDAQVLRFDSAQTTEYWLHGAAVTDTESMQPNDDLYVLGKHSAEELQVAEFEQLQVAASSSEQALLSSDSQVALPGGVSRDTSPYYVQVLASTPLFYWRLGEISGNVIFDKQRRADGVLSGNLTFVRGLIAGENTALYFDGSTTVSLGDQYLDYENFSLEFVAKEVVGEILGKSTELSVQATTEGVEFTVYGAAGAVAYSCSTTERTGHFVFTIRAGIATLHVNGVEVSSSIQAVPTLDTATPLQLGAGAVGVIDEVSIYNRALLPEEIFRHYYAAILNQDYTAAIQALRPFVHLPFATDELEHDDLLDVQLDAPAVWVDGPKKFFVQGDSALQLAAGDQVHVQTSGIFQQVSDYTIGCTFRIDGPGPGVVRQLAGVDGGWSLTVQDDNTVLFEPGGARASVRSSNTVAEQTWHNVYATHVAGKSLLYLDGVLEAEVANTSGLAASQTPGEGNLSLGGAGFEGSLAEFFATERPMTKPQAAGLHKIVQHGRSDAGTFEFNNYSIESAGFRVYTYEVVVATA